jgi:hypothetical protein
MTDIRKILHQVKGTDTPPPPDESTEKGVPRWLVAVLCIVSIATFWIVAVSDDGPSSDHAQTMATAAESAAGAKSARVWVMEAEGDEYVCGYGPPQFIAKKLVSNPSRPSDFQIVLDNSKYDEKFKGLWERLCQRGGMDPDDYAAAAAQLKQSPKLRRPCSRDDALDPNGLLFDTCEAIR